MAWLRVPGAAEVLEVTPTPALRREVATALGVPRHADLDDLYGWRDDRAWAIAARCRLAVRGVVPATDLQCDRAGP